MHNTSDEFCETYSLYALPMNDFKHVLYAQHIFGETHTLYSLPMNYFKRTRSTYYELCETHTLYALPMNDLNTYFVRTSHELR